MKLKELQEKTQKLLIFDKKNLKILEKDDNNLSANLKYWLNKGEVVSLKKGFYILRSAYEKEPDKQTYLEYIANQMLRPSYLSLEYVLSKYGILSEPVRVISSVSLKSSREFNKSLATWRFYSLPSSLFTGYKLKYFKKQVIMEASLAKALFDFLYLRFRRGKCPTEKSFINLRLNLEILNQDDWKELFSYFPLVPNSRFQTLKKIIEKYAN
jgi:predicted transcriptional regulator of viral defense system